jgi:hypothetical protein
LPGSGAPFCRSGRSLWTHGPGRIAQCGRKPSDVS